MIPISPFRIPHSAFRIRMIPISPFRIPHSAIRIRAVLTFGLLLLALGAQAQNPVGNPTCKTTVVATNNWVVTTLGARVYSITAFNASASDQYLFVVNTNSAAFNGHLPALAPVLIPAGKTGWWDFSDVGFTFSSGVVVCSSSTAASLTIGSADLTISINYHGKN
jgi:hypothetical protein